MNAYTRSGLELAQDCLCNARNYLEVGNLGAAQIWLRSAGLTLALVIEVAQSEREISATVRRMKGGSR